MAFLRVEKKASGTYLRIVKTYKKEGKVKHNTLFSLGKVEDYAVDQLERIGKRFLELAGKSFDEIVTHELEEVARYNYGFPLVMKWLWDRYDLAPFFKKHVGSTRKISFDFQNVLKLLLCERLSEPSSKLATYLHQEDYIGLQEASLQHLYRSLDILDDVSELLRKHLYERQRSLFSERLDVVFYDVTTLYFDASRPLSQDDMRKKGYSKDGKAHKLQVVLGLVVDKLRNPVTYQLYEGNQYEGTTLRDGIATLKKSFQIDKVIMVCDRGMMSTKNLEAVKDSGYDYIIGERLKKLSKEVQQELIDSSKHRPLSTGQQDKYTYHDYRLGDKRIICTYSEKRARKDAHERQVLVEKAIALLDNPGTLKAKNKKGAKRYLSYQEDDNISLDEARIRQEEAYDGFLAIATNRKDLAVHEVIEQYTNLFQVEHAFRTLKSTVNIRPMYHWNPKRIRGHVAICFLAYLFLNDLEKSLKWTSNELIRTLDKMQVSKIRQNEQEYFYLRSNICENTKHLIEKLRLVVPKDTTPQNLINQYFS